MLDWVKPRRGDKPASASDLSIREIQESSEIADIEAKVDQIEKALPDLIARDPERGIDAQQTLVDLQALLPTKRRTLSLLKEAIVQAEAREQRANVEQRLTQRISDRDRLARTLRAEYERAAKAFNDVLAKIDADAEACERMTAEARQFGLQGVLSAEFMLRGDYKRRRLGFETLTAVEIPSWEGGFGFPIR